MGRYRTIQRYILILMLVLAAFLLGKFATDFLVQDLALGVPFTLLVLATLTAAAANLFRPWARGSDAVKPRGPILAAEVLLIAAIPVGFLASSLDCTGLSWSGCSSFCTFVKDVWVPMIALGGIVYLVSGKRLLLLVMAGMSFLPLVPHCVCYNVANAWWIDHLGASPTCYAWGLAVSMVALSALVRGANRWVSVVMCYTVISGALSFFVGHHYFHFPW